MTPTPMTPTERAKRRLEFVTALQAERTRWSDLLVVLDARDGSWELRERPAELPAPKEDHVWLAGLDGRMDTKPMQFDVRRAMRVVGSEAH